MNYAEDDYGKNSLVPNHIVNTGTGELTPAVKNHKAKISRRADGVLSYNAGDMYLARQTCGLVGHALIESLLKKHIQKVSHISNAGFDLMFLDGAPGEVKTGRVGNRCVIIESQLDHMSESGFYCLVYYKVEGYNNPTEAIVYAKSQLKIGAGTYLKRCLKIHSVYIFPRSDIVYFYNLPTTSRYPINDNKRGQPVEYYVGVGIRNAQRIFSENNGGFEQTKFCLLSPKGAIPVYMNGFTNLKL